MEHDNFMLAQKIYCTFLMYIGLLHMLINIEAYNAHFVVCISLTFPSRQSLITNQSFRHTPSL